MTGQPDSATPGSASARGAEDSRGSFVAALATAMGRPKGALDAARPQGAGGADPNGPAGSTGGAPGVPGLPVASLPPGTDPALTATQIQDAAGSGLLGGQGAPGLPGTQIPDAGSGPGRGPVPGSQWGSTPGSGVKRPGGTPVGATLLAGMLAAASPALQAQIMPGSPACPGGTVPPTVATTATGPATAMPGGPAGTGTPPGPAPAPAPAPATPPQPAPQPTPQVTPQVTGLLPTPGAQGLTAAPARQALQAAQAAQAFPVAPAPAAPAKGLGSSGSGLPGSGPSPVPSGLVPAPTLGAAPSGPAAAQPGPSALAHRVMEAIAQIQDAPPPAHVVVELPELDGLQLRISLTGSMVHLAVVGGTGDAALAPRFGTLVQDVASGLSGRGLQLGDVSTGDRQGAANQGDRGNEAPPPSHRTVAVPPRGPQSAGLRI